MIDQFEKNLLPGELEVLSLEILHFFQSALTILTIYILCAMGFPFGAVTRIEIIQWDLSVEGCRFHSVKNIGSAVLGKWLVGLWVRNHAWGF